MALELVSRQQVATAALLLLIGTLVIVVDVRFGTFDVLPDVVGGILVLIGVFRVREAVRGADAATVAMLILATIGLGVTLVETFTVGGPIVQLLAVAQVLGTLLLADLLARVLAATEPDLARWWRTTFHLILWLGIVPLLLFVIIGRAADSVQIESPLVLVIVAILAVPFLALLVALYRTSRPPLTADVDPSPTG